MAGQGGLQYEAIEDRIKRGEEAFGVGYDLWLGILEERKLLAQLFLSYEATLIPILKKKAACLRQPKVAGRQSARRKAASI